jgi:hypothetical protein
MDRGGETADEMVNEGYPICDSRLWSALVAGEDEGVLLLRQAKLLEAPLVLVGELGSLPSGDLHILHSSRVFWSRVFG